MIELKVNGFKTTGRGTSGNESEAIYIAFSEAVERLIIKESKFPNSSGCAVHTDELNSIASSKNELIERDCFLCYFYLGSNLRKIEYKEKNNLTQFFKKLRITYRNYILYSDDIQICLNVIFHDSGLILGLGTNSNKEYAVHKAMIESIRQYIHIIHYKNAQSISLEEFKLKKNYTFNDHGNLLFNKAYLSNMLKSFKTKKRLEYFYPNKGFVSSQFKSAELSKVPLVFTRTTNKNLQSLFLGDVKNNINTKRIYDLQEEPKTILFNLPHPLR